MAIFIFKIIAVVVRTVAKPLISWATYYNRLKLQESNSKYMYLKKYINWLGQMTNYYNTKLNRKVFNLSKTDPIKKLSEDKAIEKGAEFTSEVLIYSILLTIPILEWWRQSKINSIKEEMKDTGIKRLRIDAECLHQQNKKLKKELKEIKDIITELNNNI